MLPQDQDLTAQDVIDLLSKLPDKKVKVHFAYPSRDHWHTTLTPAVKFFQMAHITHNEYHDDFALQTDTESEANNGQQFVLLLSTKPLVDDMLDL